MKNMKKKKPILRRAASAMLAGTLGACVSIFGSPIPDDPGLYALQGDGRYLKLDGAPKWERKTWTKRSNLNGNLRFVVVHPSLADRAAPAEAKVQLFKVGWVRSEISPSGEIGPIHGPQWVAPGIARFKVPLRFTPVERERSAIGASPEGGTLEPGLYSLQINNGSGQVNARFGVGWPNVDRKQYATANCLDHYIGGDVPYRPCSDQQLATLGQGLRVFLVKPDYRLVNGKSTLVVKGTIVNVSDRPRLVPPMLEASLRDRAGQILHKWQFSAPVGRLRPGESAPFQVVAREVPQGTSRAFVTFASMGGESPSVAGN